MIFSKRVSITTTGAAGSATGSGDINAGGLLLGIYIDYSASAPATTDITITDGQFGNTILAVANNNTDGWYPVADQSVGADGVAVSGYGYYPIDGSQADGPSLGIAVAGCDALTDAVVVHARIAEL